MIWRYFVISIIGFLLTNCASVPPGLNEKLEKQWQHYALARTNLLRSVETEKSGDFKALSRDDWEKSIALEGREAFNESDLKSLQLIPILRYICAFAGFLKQKSLRKNP